MMMKLLYVDDEPINLLLFETMFENKYDVLTAETGQEGIEIINKNLDIKIVISDMGMPNMNGLEFISIAKAQLPEIQFYMLTGYEITPEIRKSLSSGLILKCFKKPFKTDEIESVLRKNFRGK